MDKDEFETIGQQKKQHLVNRSLKQRERANSTNKKQKQVIISRENLDTVPQKSKNWLIPGIVAAVSIAITSVIVGSQLKAPSKDAAGSIAPSTPVAESNDSLSNPPGATSTADPEGEGQMLLEQAKLLADRSQPEKLARAIAIVKKLPPNTSVSSEAQSLVAIWSQKILQEANNKASGGQLNEAIAIAKLVPEQTKARQQAQKQIKGWQEQQSRAEQKKFAATLAAVSQLPPPIETIPLPPPPQVNPVTLASKSVSRQSKPASQTKTQVRNSLANANVNKTKLKPAVKSQRKNPNNGGQLLAGDPYLNVKIPQMNVPQLQAKTIPSSRIVTSSNSYGFGNNYGFRNVVVKAPTVAIQLRDNVDEDGDYVSLIVNGKTYTRNHLILNHGKIFMVDLQPGENRVDIVGVRDGQGGITLEVNVAGIGNVNNRPIPEGSTASFIINREQ